MNNDEENVARYYDTAIFEAEVVRLSRDFPVERAITLRWLERLLPPAASVAEIGVGGGTYSEYLARQGCRIHLVDISGRLLEAALQRIRDAGLQSAIAGVSQESATRLDSLQAEAFDVVLLLGPLYHLCSPAARRHAVAEAARILKPGGLLFAAAINRLSYLRELFHESPHLALDRKSFHEQYLREGNLNPEVAPPIGYAHLSTVAEFRELLAQSFTELALVGVESFTAPWQKALNDLPPDQAEAWLDIVERTGQTAEGLAASDHFLYVGRRLSTG